MSKRLTPDERQEIAQLAKKGLRPHEIKREISTVRDSRTIKHYLDLLPREQLPELLKQRKWLAHQKIIQNRIKRLERELEFPASEDLDVTDLEKGYRAFSSPSHVRVIQWQQADDGSYTVKLDDKFDRAIEHLRSSRRKHILDKLDQWQRIGGRCIVHCYYLRINIQKEAERQTRLINVPDVGQRGLLEDFSWTIYRLALSNEKKVEEKEEYDAINRHDGLCLLRWGGWNLAWVEDNEVDRIKDIHRRLVLHYQRVSTTLDILEEEAELEQIGELLRDKLRKFAGMQVIPGKCLDCPQDT